MKKQLDEFYLNVALEVARAEQEAAGAAQPVRAMYTDECFLPTRAEALGHGTPPTPDELRHMRECRPCVNFVEIFVPPARRLLAALKRHAPELPEHLLGGWVETAQANMAQLLRWLKERGPGYAYFEGAAGLGRTEPFVQGAFTLRLDRRADPARLVVWVKSTDETLCGSEVTVLLVGDKGEGLRVPVRLCARRGQICSGSMTAGSTLSEVLDELGPVIIPVVLTDEGSRFNGKA